ncbi:outer membrane beta-barrel protein [Noviherbaspirillum sp. ST9]|uniref:outer membrane beta-barrel protein n=1 Tax=Noviherbaspirillum sp. ST9 TaxID=3401606 RepID=UPI003B586938
MKKYNWHAAAAAALLLCATSSQAQEAASTLRFVATAGLTGGGDTIATAQFTNGSSENIKSGGLVEFGAGLIWEMPSLPIAVQGTVKYHVDDTSAARNGKIDFDRVPIEALVYYTGVKQWRFGAGVRMVTSAEYKARVDGQPGESVRFKDATGLVLETGYAIAPRTWLNVRYVSEKYKPDTYSRGAFTADVSGAEAYSGNHVGINLLYIF